MTLQDHTKVQNNATSLETRNASVSQTIRQQALSLYIHICTYIYINIAQQTSCQQTLVEIVDVIKIAGVEAVNTVVTADPLYWCLLHLRACRREFSQKSALYSLNSNKFNDTSFENVCLDQVQITMTCDSLALSPAPPPSLLFARPLFFHLPASSRNWCKIFFLYLT